MVTFSKKLIDKETAMEMLICCCTYDEACAYIEEENKDNQFGRFVYVYKGIHNLVEMKFEKALFFYDEERGVLLRKE